MAYGYAANAWQWPMRNGNVGMVYALWITCWDHIAVGHSWVAGAHGILDGPDWDGRLSEPGRPARRLRSAVRWRVLGVASAWGIPTVAQR